MKIRKEYIIGIVTFLSGLFFFCIYQELLIIHFGTLQKQTLTQKSQSQRKTIDLYFWKHEEWKKESVDIMWSEDSTKTLSYIVNQWLNLLDEEGILNKKVTVQHVALNQAKNTAYLSFDRYPLNKEASTHEKHMMVESLLKTVSESGITLSFFHFLVHHKSIPDAHLDFTHPWPLQGFLQH